MRFFFIPVVSAVALALAGCGGSSGDKAAATSAATPAAPASSSAAGPTIVMKDIRFKPETMSVKVGQTVTWKNEDAVNHNVVADSGASFKSKDFNQGGTYSFKATKAGTVKYECKLHPGMVGTLTVK